MTSRRWGERRGRRRERRGPGLPVREIIAAAAQAARRDAWRIFVVAFAVSMVGALAELIAHHLVDRTNQPLLVLSTLGASSVSLLGSVFLSGFLCRLVSEPGRPGAGIGATARSLPWGPLIRADLLVALIGAAGLLALVIPGLIALTLLAVTGPVIEIERRGAWAGLRESARLVRPHFWGVALLGLVPILLVNAAEAALPDPDHLPALAFALLGQGVLEAVLESALSLLLVQLCFRLMAADRARQAAGPVPQRA
jgi:hypothetical protein